MNEIKGEKDGEKEVKENYVKERYKTGYGNKRYNLAVNILHFQEWNSKFKILMIFLKYQKV